VIKEKEGGKSWLAFFPSGYPGVPGNGIREPVVVAGGEKEKIFGRGYGKNTGMGLFLSREIPAITGILITGNGERGKGARFAIRVLPGKFRKGSAGP